jgi:hypothetical protein
MLPLADTAIHLTSHRNFTDPSDEFFPWITAGW